MMSFSSIRSGRRSSAKRTSSSQTGSYRSGVGGVTGTNRGVFAYKTEAGAKRWVAMDKIINVEEIPVAAKSSEKKTAKRKAARKGMK